jgi:hypothetical protein
MSFKFTKKSTPISRKILVIPTVMNTVSYLKISEFT